MKVLVCDDREDLYEEITTAIGEAGQADIEIETLIGPELADELEKLFAKVDSCLNNPNEYKTDNESPFDTHDVIILDDNLAFLGNKGARLTAESIAGYVRAFTAAPYVVSLNKNPFVDFDLRCLVGDYATRADLALNTEHLKNPALWTGAHDDAEGGFLPWYWPKLGAVSRRRLDQIDFVEGRLEDKVFDALEFPEDEDTIGFLSLHARGALSPDAESIVDVTFLNVFMAGNRSLPARSERDDLLKALKGGNDDVRKIVSRVVAADIDHWFRRDVVGPQEVLVDIPHLLMRMPFLLGDRAADIEQWNRAVSETEAPFGMEQSLYDEHLAGVIFAHDMWVASPNFWWPKLKENEKLNELFFSEKQEWPDVVFCEDSANFRDRTPDDGTPPTEFSAEFEGSWGRRYVARLEGFRYSPMSRFAV